MSRRRTSSINIRNFIGTTSLRTSRPLSITSMLPRVGVGGSPASTATYFVPSVSYAIRGHSRDALLRARRKRPRSSRAAEQRDELAPFHRLPQYPGSRLTITGFGAFRRRGPILDIVRQLRPVRKGAVARQ